MSVHQRQSLQVTSILSTLMLAQSAAHALMYVLTRQSLFHKEKTLSNSPLKGENYKSSQFRELFLFIAS